MPLINIYGKISKIKRRHKNDVDKILKGKQELIGATYT